MKQYFKLLVCSKTSYDLKCISTTKYGSSKHFFKNGWKWDNYKSNSCCLGPEQDITIKSELISSPYLKNQTTKNLASASNNNSQFYFIEGLVFEIWIMIFITTWSKKKKRVVSELGFMSGNLKDKTKKISFWFPRRIEADMEKFRIKFFPHVFVNCH